MEHTHTHQKKEVKIMTCKNCIHYGACAFSSIITKDCKLFKNKTDFVEIVRCKDCKHRGRWRCPMFTLAYNERINKYVGTNNTQDDGFCYRGER